MYNYFTKFILPSLDNSIQCQFTNCRKCSHVILIFHVSIPDFKKSNSLYNSGSRLQTPFRLLYY